MVDKLNRCEHDRIKNQSQVSKRCNKKKLAEEYGLRDTLLIIPFVFSLIGLFKFSLKVTPVGYLSLKLVASHSI